MNDDETADETAVTHDTLLDGRVRLTQPKDGFRAAVDSVLLAAAVPARARQKVLEPGMGAGAAALCLARRIPGLSITGLELQPGMARLARANAEDNDLTEVIRVIEGDLKAPPPGLVPGDFEQVMANPPFVADGTVPPEESKALANIEGGTTLRAWIGFCLSMLAHKGTLTMIHRADRLDRIISLLSGRAGEIQIIPLWPKAGQPAKRAIVRARKGVRSPLVLHPGLILHEADGAYTPEAKRILRDGEPLI